jgi:hypothetical protein
VLGLPSLAFGCFGLAHLVAALRKWSSSDRWLPELIYFPLALWFGWKMTINAIVNDPKRRRPRSNRLG